MATLKQKQKLLADVAKYLAKQGVDAPDMASATDRDYRSDTAVAVFARDPHGFVPQRCKYCERVFGTNSKIIGYCSDEHRRLDWEKTTGLAWDAVEINTDCWDGNPPLIISPEQFSSLKRLSDWFSTNRTSLSSLVEKPSSQIPEVAFLEESPEDTVLPGDQDFLLSLLGEPVSEKVQEVDVPPPTIPQPEPDFEDWLLSQG